MAGRGVRAVPELYDAINAMEVDDLLLWTDVPGARKEDFHRVQCNAYKYAEAAGFKIVAAVRGAKLYIIRHE